MDEYEFERKLLKKLSDRKMEKNNKKTCKIDENDYNTDGMTKDDIKRLNGRKNEFYNR